VSRSELPNLVFAGTSLAAGGGKAAVFAIGMNTEFGKIAHLTQSVTAAPSPLQKEMGRATAMVTALAAGIGLLVFCWRLCWPGWTGGKASSSRWA
jgi:P-type Ca2+ transporter type 2C